jgi:hypothetical protein
MIRQAIGRATLSAEKKEVKPRREIIINDLYSLMGKLFPASPEAKVRAFVTKVVDKTISLRNAMSEEQSIYRCFLPDNGDTFDDSIFQVETGEKAKGNILLCMFPGLRRLNIGLDQKKGFVIVVKAIVKLEGVFGRKTISRKEVPGKDALENEGLANETSEENEVHITQISEENGVVVESSSI